MKSYGGAAFPDRNPAPQNKRPPLLDESRNERDFRGEHEAVDESATGSVFLFSARPSALRTLRQRCLSTSRLEVMAHDQNGSRCLVQYSA